LACFLRWSRFGRSGNRFIGDLRASRRRRPATPAAQRLGRNLTDASGFNPSRGPGRGLHRKSEAIADGRANQSDRGIAETAPCACDRVRQPTEEDAAMDEDRFNMSVRKLLKVVGVTSQREIEGAVRDAVKAGKLAGTETLTAKVTLSLPS